MKKISYLVLCLLLVNLLAACGLLPQNHRDFTFYQAKENITELSRVYITWDEGFRNMTIEVKETIGDEKLTPALQALCELPCTDSPFEPRDTPYGECYMIKYADGNYQLLYKYCNNYYDTGNKLLNAEFLSFHDEEFFSLWNCGLSSIEN